MRDRPDGGSRGTRIGLREKLVALLGAAPLTVIFLIVTGGIWLGVFTSFESAAVGTLLTFALTILRGEMSWRRLITAFANTIASSGMLMAIRLGAKFFTSFLAVSG